MRTGADLYRITDNNGWHYHYPPLLAIVLTPLASPPPNADTTGMPPFALSAALWYVFNLVFLLVAVHRLASALEQTAADPAIRRQPAGCRRWWMLRLVPILTCLPPIAHTLMRGQLNMLLLLLFSSMLVALLRGRRLEGGLWLAGAICVKIIPAFLLLYPLWRRDGRMLAGCAVGLVIGLGVIPGLVFGPERTVGYYRTVGQAVLLPGLTHDGDQSHPRTDRHDRDRQPIPDSDFAQRPAPRSAHPADHATLGLRCTALALGGLLTLGTLLAAGWSRRWPPGTNTDGPGTVLFVGALLMNMLLLSPVGAHSLLRIVGAARDGFAGPAAGRSRLSWRWYVSFLANMIVGMLPHVPTWDWVRDVGLVM